MTCNRRLKKRQWEVTLLFFLIDMRHGHKYYKATTTCDMGIFLNSTREIDPPPRPHLHPQGLSGKAPVFCALIQVWPCLERRSIPPSIGPIRAGRPPPARPADGVSGRTGRVASYTLTQAPVAPPLYTLSAVKEMNTPSPSPLLTPNALTLTAPRLFNRPALPGR